MEEIPFNPARRLCPDGACVGVLGEGGRCSVCGRRWGAGGGAGADLDVDAAAGGADGAGAGPNPGAADDVDADGLAADGASGGDDAGSRAGGFDSSRRLCDDGSCVGVVGPDGACGTCGRRAG
jgi:hypothetical protein